MSNAERVSYQMFVDALTGSDMQHPFMIEEYFFGMDLEEDDIDVALVQGLNKAITKALLSVLDEFWKPSDA